MRASPSVTCARGRTVWTIALLAALVAVQAQAREVERRERRAPRELKIGLLNAQNLQHHNWILNRARPFDKAPERDGKPKLVRAARGLIDRVRSPFEQLERAKQWFKRGFKTNDVARAGIENPGSKTILAAAIDQASPDVLVMTEVAERTALEMLVDQHQLDYPYLEVIDSSARHGNHRKTNVAIMSKFPIKSVRAHRDEGLFRRAFAEIDVEVPVSEGKKATLTLFAGHSKSKRGDPEETRAQRMREHTRYAEVMRERFGSELERANALLLGDFNSEPQEPELAPLLRDAHVPLADTPAEVPEDQRWTHFWINGPKQREDGRDGRYSYFDYILPTQGLHERAGRPRLTFQRRHLSLEADRVKDERFRDIGTPVSEDGYRRQGLPEKVSVGDEIPTDRYPVAGTDHSYVEYKLPIEALITD